MLVCTVESIQSIANCFLSFLEDKVSWDGFWTRMESSARATKRASSRPYLGAFVYKKELVISKFNRFLVCLPGWEAPRSATLSVDGR